MSQVFSDKNFIRINGMSNNILKFISVNEQIDQLAYIKKLASEIWLRFIIYNLFIDNIIYLYYLLCTNLNN